MQSFYRTRTTCYLVLPVLRLTWSDWGSPQRLAETKRTMEGRPRIANALKPDTINEEDEFCWI